MSAVNNLLDKYREICSLPSDSAAADSLGVKRQALHQWRKELSWPSEEHIMAMAKAINEPAERWFVQIAADRASPTARKVWLKLAQAAAAIALLVCSGSPTKAIGYTTGPAIGDTNAQITPVYIMRIPGTFQGVALIHAR